MEEKRLDSLVQDDKTHHNESENREDVVGGVSEERPPCQSDGLWREERYVPILLRNYWCVLADVCSTCPANMPHRPMITRMLKTAEPTMVPTPTSPLVMKTPAGSWKRMWSGNTASRKWWDITDTKVILKLWFNLWWHLLVAFWTAEDLRLNMSIIKWCLYKTAG